MTLKINLQALRKKRSVKLRQISMAANCHPRNKLFFDHFEKLRVDFNRKGQTHNVKSVRKVLMSLSRCPYPVTSLAEAEELEGVGSWLSQEFAKVLGSLQNPEINDKDSTTRSDEVISTPKGSPSKRRRTRESLAWDERMREKADMFMVEISSSSDEGEKRILQTVAASLPAAKSGLWSLLLAVYLFSTEAYFTKASLHSLVDCLRVHISDCSAPTALTLKNTLAKGWLRQEDLNYSLTPEGTQIASRLHRRCAILAALPTEVKTSTSVDIRNFFAKPSASDSADWKLQLLADTRELANKLPLDESAESRVLPLGDFTWVWRKGGVERFTGVLVERKTIGDLASSIIDGRYEEQKGRIMRTRGVTKMIYLIEGNFRGFQYYRGVTADAVRTAIRHIQLISGFDVIISDDPEHSCLILNEISNFLLTSPKAIDQLQCFEEFCRESKKTNDNHINEMVIKMLLAIPGLGSEGVNAFVNLLETKYELGATPANLFTLLSTENPESLVALLKKSGNLKKSISSKVLDMLTAFAFS